MKCVGIEESDIGKLLVHQLSNYWFTIDETSIIKYVPAALHVLEINYFGSANARFFDGESVLFSPYTSVQWMNFLYRLSHLLYLHGGGYKRGPSLLFE